MKFFQNIYLRVATWFLIGLIPWFLHPSWLSQYIADLKNIVTLDIWIVMPFVSAVIFAVFSYLDFKNRKDNKSLSKRYFVLKIIVFIASLYVNASTIVN